MAVNALQAFIKTAAVSGIAFFWVNFTVESLKMAWRIISYSPEDEKNSDAEFPRYIFFLFLKMPPISRSCVEIAKNFMITTSAT